MRQDTRHTAIAGPRCLPQEAEIITAMTGISIYPRDRCESKRIESNPTRTEQDANCPEEERIFSMPLNYVLEQEYIANSHRRRLEMPKVDEHIGKDLILNIIFTSFRFLICNITFFYFKILLFCYNRKIKND